MIAAIYKKLLLKRYDKDDATPYYGAADFPELCREEDFFENSENVRIRYYLYRYAPQEAGPLILFCPGVGPGHTAYLREIETLCRAGYRVLTLDYTGCGASGGERLPSLNAPTRDAFELLERLRPSGEVVPVGHSLGGYTALNLARLAPEIKRAVVLSGFSGVADLLPGFVKLPPLARRIERYEAEICPRFASSENLAFLAQTTDRILWIHSKDDPTVPYRTTAGRVAGLGNPNVRVITVEDKKHNPQYTAEAVKQMNAWIGRYTLLVKTGRLNTPEKRRAYFSDKPIERMTEPDPAVFAEILRFIGE